MNYKLIYLSIICWFIHSALEASKGGWGGREKGRRIGERGEGTFSSFIWIVSAHSRYVLSRL